MAWQFLEQRCSTCAASCFQHASCTHGVVIPGYLPRLDHLVLDQAQRLNPLTLSTYQDEDYVGKAKRMALNSANPPKMGYQCLQRYAGWICCRWLREMELWTGVYLLLVLLVYYVTTSDNTTCGLTTGCCREALHDSQSPASREPARRWRWKAAVTPLAERWVGWWTMFYGVYGSLLIQAVQLTLLTDSTIWKPISAPLDPLVHVYIYLY